MERRRLDPWTALARLSAIFVVVQGFAAFVYSIERPELTQMQVLMAAAEWAVPFRWL